MNFNWNPLKERVSEQLGSFSFQLGSAWSGFRRTFWAAWESRGKGSVNFQFVRDLYRNDEESAALGAGFCKPIIDLPVEFMGLPRSASGDELVDEFLSNCFAHYWAPQLQQMFRNAMRDSITVVRLRQPGDNALMTETERISCYLEVLMPETVDVYYNRDDQTVIDLAVIRHEILELLEDRNLDTRLAGQTYRAPQTELRVIYEEISPERFRYYDETQGEWRTDLEMPNPWGFVPLIEVYNEWDSTLLAGISDLEASYPFVQAFHNVLQQALAAHKYHSIPKAKFKINDVMQFILNNFPDSFGKDQNNRPIPEQFTGTINWKGTEILFLEADEDAGFMEAKSVLGDSNTLLGFLLECICIASETPQWAFMLSLGAGQGAQTAQTLPFTNKIKRKQVMFQDTIQKLAKMVLKISGQQPICVPLAWQEITVEDVVNKAAALNQTVMALEVAAQRQVISDTTYREHLRAMIPQMKSPSEEAAQAKSNVQLAAPATGNPNSTSSKNGAGNAPAG